MITDLINVNQLDFNRLSPEVFAERVERMHQEHGEEVYQHAFLQDAAAFYQHEFYQRRSQFRPSTTIRLKNAWGCFIDWCVENEHQSLPATRMTVESYLIAQEKRLHRNTLKIIVWAIGTMHKISGMPNVCNHPYIKARMAVIVNQKVVDRERISQASPFREVHLDALTELWGGHRSISRRRDLMVLTLCYETMLRKSNIERILIEEIEFKSDGTALLVVPYTKTNHSGEDEVRQLSKPLTDMIKDYLNHSTVRNCSKYHLLQRLKHSGNKCST